MLLRSGFAFLVTPTFIFSALLSSGELEEEKNESATGELSNLQGTFQPTYLEPIGNTVHQYIRPNTRPESLTQFPEAQLTNIYDRLKTFLASPCFDHITFEKDADQIEMDLKNITSRVNELSWPPNFTQQIKHVRKVFWEMVDAIEPLRHFVFLGRSDLHLVNRMIEINVKLNGMYDSSGKPESASEGYEDTIARYKIMLQILRDRFKALGGVPIGVRRMFEKQSVAAGDTIKTLRSHVKVNSEDTSTRRIPRQWLSCV